MCCSCIAGGPRNVCSEQLLLLLLLLLQGKGGLSYVSSLKMTTATCGLRSTPREGERVPVSAQGRGRCSGSVQDREPTFSCMSVSWPASTHVLMYMR